MKNKRKAEKRTRAKFDWRAFDAMTDEEVMAAALSDPDAQPLTEADMKRMKRTPQVRIIRRAMKMSQEEFAECFRIPIGTLRDWEQGRVEPDQAARAYLKVIASNPNAVHAALDKKLPPTQPGIVYERDSKSLRAYKAAAAKRIPWLMERLKETMRELGEDVDENMTVRELRATMKKVSIPKGR